eukprot:12454784-Ditylum_brightwellii.AAC.1
MYVHYDEFDGKVTENTRVTCKSYSERGGCARLNTKQVKRPIVNGDEILQEIILLVEGIPIASDMGIATTQWMSVESPSSGTKEVHTMKERIDPARVRRCDSAVA